ncbi:proton-coupled zinc antiporter SLC30A2 [Zeugodacus cucurbitae]|uniref:proton-coupled zinc antiporter SLC30A2 n=1 Tax=Zeugodacus cucurbitae TaxID=28588 RepID=UPI0023D90B11|nr:proton-coupled zinc antiporter SLC30A2 [Zeugodacus cucurbitae]
MSKYQLLLEPSATGDEDAATTGVDNNAIITTTTATNTNLHHAAENLQALLYTDSSNESSSSSGGSGQGRTTRSNNNNTNNRSGSQSNSMNSHSSGSTSSWEYSPFDSISTNNNNNNTNQTKAVVMSRATPTTTTTMSTAALSLADMEAKTSSTSLLLDAYEADDTTMEVPLLGGNNNADYHDHAHQHQQFNTASAAATCHCQLPGFGANLHTKSTQDAKFKILLAITLCCVFMIVEFLGGYMAGSLAIMTDAAHLASDCISFVIGLVAIWLGGRPPDDRMTFGYKRMEVMGAIVSILGIWILTATLIIVAMERLYSNDFDLNAKTMMVISGIGILINIVMAFILHGSSLTHGAAHGHSHAHAHAHSHSHSHAHGHSAAAGNGLLQANGSNGGGGGNELKKCDTVENLNLRAAMIHVIGDLVQSIGVFLASLLILIYPNAKYADPLCTVLFSVIVFMTTVRLFRESVAILLDAVPSSISLKSLALDLGNIDGVKSVHHLNVWSHTNNHSVMMVHLVIDFLSDSNTVLQRATQVACGSKYDIKHCTIQIERSSTA